MKIILLAILILSNVYDFEYSEKVLDDFKSTYERGYYSRSYEIPEYLKEDMYGKSVEANNPVLSSLLAIDLAYHDFDGNIKIGTIIANKNIKAEIEEIFEILFYEKFKFYQIKPICYYDGDDLISMENNNTSSFNYRTIKNSSKLSKHSEGMAIDINPIQNPYFKKGLCLPNEGRKFLNRRKNEIGQINADSEIVKIFKSYGWTWGGEWNSPKDYQHFEK